MNEKQLEQFNDLVENEVYHYYDGPLLYSLKNKSNDKIFIFLSCENFKSSFYSYDVFLVTEIFPQQLNSIKKKQLKLYDFYHMGQDLFLYYVYYNEEEGTKTFKPITLEEVIKLNYLPDIDFEF